MLGSFQSLKRFFYLYGWSRPQDNFSPDERCEIAQAQKELFHVVVKLGRGLMKISCGPFKEGLNIPEVNLPKYYNLVFNVCLTLDDILRFQSVVLWHPLSFYQQHISLLHQLNDWVWKFEHPRENDPMIRHLIEVESSLSSSNLVPRGERMFYDRDFNPLFPDPLQPPTKEFIWEVNDLVQQHMAILVQAALGPAAPIAIQSPQNQTLARLLVSEVQSPLRRQLPWSIWRCLAMYQKA
ncbi:hypothetical protein C8J56DRAFT_911493 [Mycena floridula]|nr:hypothetical protein C8J56DRAFT_911493 [Mycena floridula]